MDLDVVLVNVSPPDRHGLRSLGVSVEIVILDRARRKVIAQINPKMRRTFGDAIVH